MIFAQMLEIVALCDLASVLCARKFSFAPPGGGFDPKTPLFGWKMAFWAYIFETAHQIFLKLGTKLHLGEAKKMFQADFWKKFSFGRFWPFFAIFGHFWPKNQVFELFIQNRTSEFYITCSKARNNCFQSFNGSFVSGKILVLAVLAHFLSKIHCLWWQIEVFDHFWLISSSLLMFVWQFLFFKPSLWFRTR